MTRDILRICLFDQVRCYGGFNQAVIVFPKFIRVYSSFLPVQIRIETYRGLRLFIQSQSQELNHLARKLIFQMGSGGRLVFMHITRVAQSCHLGNKSKSVLGPHQILNHQKRFIGKRVSSFVYWTYRNVKSTTIKPLCFELTRTILTFIHCIIWYRLWYSYVLRRSIDSLFRLRSFYN